MFLFISLLFISCTKETQEEEVRVKPVQVIILEEKIEPIELHYSGRIYSEELKKISFKSSGKISNIYVEEGQMIQRGDLLADLDTKDLRYNVKAAEHQMGAAKARYQKAVNGATEEEVNQAELIVKKALDAYQYTLDQYEKIKQLYEEEAISENILDQTKLELDIKESELQQAEESYNQIKNGAREEDKQALLSQYEQAKTDYEYKNSMIQDAKITSNLEGYVVDIFYKEGEMVAAGYPVIAIRNGQQIVKVGVTQKDAMKIDEKTRVKIKIEALEIKGTIHSVDEVPNEQTYTYTVEILLNDTSQQIIPLGVYTDVKFILGEEKGIWIPITAISSNGEDYVFTANKDRAELKKVTIESTKGSLVKVNGLQNGEQLIIEGMEKLLDGDLIHLTEK